MKIEFQGAARTVTGSKHILHINGKKILLDCGLFQGKRKEAEIRNRQFPFSPSDISAMILSHAHIDHSGNIPNLVKFGYSGRIYTTPATVDLLKEMLLDSGHIQERDVEYVNKKHKKKGLPEVEPLYTVDDAESSLDALEPLPYKKVLNMDNFSFSLYDAGHILGSAQVLIESEGKRILFTGDLGRDELPIIRNPEKISDIDILIMESTYGNRLHKDIENARKDFQEIVNKVYKRKGKIIVPAFSVGRTQEIVYTLDILSRENKIPRIPIYVDSPLSVNVTEVFSKHPECFDKEALEEFRKDGNKFGFGEIKYIKDTQDSIALNHRNDPMIIISASGMCEHGRILHHLKNNIGNPRNAILIVGYQAENTLGRKLVEKEEVVRIFGEEYKRRAEVFVLNEFSAHADRSGLLNKVEETKPKKVFLVHGEPTQMDPLAQEIKNRGYEVYTPEPGEIHTL